MVRRIRFAANIYRDDRATATTRASDRSNFREKFRARSPVGYGLAVKNEKKKRNPRRYNVDNGPAESAVASFYRTSQRSLPNELHVRHDWHNYAKRIRKRRPRIINMFVFSFLAKFLLRDDTVGRYETVTSAALGDDGNNPLARTATAVTFLSTDREIRISLLRRPLRAFTKTVRARVSFDKRTGGNHAWLDNHPHTYWIAFDRRYYTQWSDREIAPRSLLL